MIGKGMGIPSKYNLKEVAWKYEMYLLWFV